MKVLVIGSGGREHALVWKIAQSPLVTKIYAAEGNGGTIREGAENVAISASDIEGLVRFAKEKNIDLVVPGPELPLTLGIVDALRAEGIYAFGPDRYCAQLEGSKSFAKAIMQKAGVPTARMTLVHDFDEGNHILAQSSFPLVLKADGLAAGKGVVICQNEDEARENLAAMLQKRVFGDAGANVLIEEYLEGEEVSLLALCDGKNAYPFPSAQDHKRAFDGDKGLNTGGMGAYSPAPILPDENLEVLCDKTIRPVLDVMAREQHPFVGVLYAGLMMTKSGPRVLEYNVRFGDPECQPLMMRLESDLVPCMLACIHGEMRRELLSIGSEKALGIVLAREGYPGSYSKGGEITGIEDAEKNPYVKVFHSGTKAEDGKIIATGGRVLCVTSRGESVRECQERGYEALSKIRLSQSFYRHDIGAKALKLK